MASAPSFSTTFPSTTPGFLRQDGRSAMEDFLDTPGALFKGPFLSLGLPFRTQDPDQPLPFRALEPGFPPYRHQFLAFERLCSATPRPALVATGTGSGKTECFMFPVLDHCLTTTGPGIKAIVIYPMNALANDQARRFAEEIHRRDNLRGRVRVGMFVGDNDESPLKEMTEQSVITCKNTQRENPPDILLTNYKMLDYLLIRPKDQPLWRYNEPGVLRYLVVDELHTFDGAQGTDLACLIRRLRDRLQAGPELAAVGTSATIGSERSLEALLDYAGKVFDTPFDREAVIREDRLTAEEFLPPQAGETRWPPPGRLRQMTPDLYRSRDDLIDAHAQLWFAQPPRGLASTDPRERDRAAVALGERLRDHVAFHTLLTSCRGVCDVAQLLEDWGRRLRSDREEVRATLDSLCALISAARCWKRPDEEHPERFGTIPFLQVRYQLWLRELRRLVAGVAVGPVLAYADDLPDLKSPLHLPVAHCRECHATAWASLRTPREPSRLSADLRAIYGAYFNQSPDTCVLLPLAAGERPTGQGLVQQVCPACRGLTDGARTDCPHCHGTDLPLVRVWLPDMNRQRQEKGQSRIVFHNDCPRCGAVNGLSLMGSRAASLSSVLIGRLFGSTYNNDHKLIAFSDSVQDAVHRAGFFGARTWRQVLRQALHQALHDRLQGMPLDRVAEHFGPFWQDKLGDAAFVAAFIAPNLEWLRDWDTLRSRGKLPEGSDLIGRWIIPRLTWEVINEFGLGSRIGRTLERTGRAVVSPDGMAIRGAVAELLPRLREEIAELADITPQALEGFITGLLWRLRTQGAFFHGNFLAEYLHARGDTFKLQRRRFMPGYGKAARPPAFLTLYPVSSNFNHILGQQATWFSHWFNKTLAAANVLASASLEQAYRLTLAALERQGLLQRHELVRGESVWTLRLDAWSCTTQGLFELHCSDCHHRVQVAAEQLPVWQTVTCLNAACTGRYREPKAFRQPPLSGKSPVRVIAWEHTGLLEPDQRREIEASFKQGNQPGAINLLSATPTMEMGIDIGNLSSVLLCSVPPAQANYLQRIGRAGRKDGNALSVAVANGVPHDLYFYTLPEEMMAGEVQPPGVFLQATAVLERQLIAYCFDQWARTGIDDSAIPATLKMVLDGIKREDQTVFPYPLIGFIATNRNRLLDGFKGLFPDLEEEGAAHLERFIFGDAQEGDISHRLLNRLFELSKQRESLLQRVKALKNEQDKLHKQPQDDYTRQTLEEVGNERDGLMRLLRSLNGTPTLNFFTDEGLLPNYAFPEEGVKLHSVIYRKADKAERPVKAGQGGQTHQDVERITYQFTRPSQAALSELAPESRFYGGGRRVEIDQVDLTVSTAEEWRLCNRCHYAENLTIGDNHATCPRCGSELWANSSQKQTLLKLRQVFARTNDRDSRIGDDSEQREPIFFNRQLLVDIPPSASVKAYRLNDERLPFGFEYLSTARFYEVNFGRMGDDGQEIEVAGRQARRPGFRICRHCGKVRKRRDDRKLNHAYSCPLRKDSATETPEDFYQALYLYRELTSEAIRLLLPLAEVAGSDTRLQSLVAALHLGLKRFFQGDVGHLQITSYSEPLEGERRRHYLVILDTVPGGTGYLKELLRTPENLLEMLALAHDTLIRCACNQDPDKDGCYRCLYAYRESRNLEATSRDAAADLLGRILRSSAELSEVAQLDQVDMNALLESELEQRFIVTLGNVSPHVGLSKQTVNGKPGWLLTLTDPQDGRVISWQVEPQVELGPADRVKLNTRPDFVIRPLSRREGLKPVAVYLDGFAYHKTRTLDDTLKRMAVFNSGQYRVWSLNWHDLPKPGMTLDPQVVDWLQVPAQQMSHGLFNKMADRLQQPTFERLDDLIKFGAFRWLLTYLEGRAETLERLRWLAFSRQFCLLDTAAIRDAAKASSYRQLAERVCPEQWRLERVEGQTVLGSRTPVDRPELTALACLPLSSLQQTDTLIDQAALLLYLDDGHSDHAAFESAWRRFWTAANLFQFLAHFAAVTASGVVAGSYEDLLASPAVTTGEEAVPADWQEALELTLYPEQAAKLIATGAPAPTVGEDLQDASGEVLGQVEWLWSEYRIAFVDQDPPLAERLVSEGWQVITDPERELESLQDGLRAAAGNHPP